MKLPPQQSGLATMTEEEASMIELAVFEGNPSEMEKLVKCPPARRLTPALTVDAQTVPSFLRQTEA